MDDADIARRDVKLALDDSITATSQLLTLLQAARVMHEAGVAPCATLRVLAHAGQAGHETVQHIAIAVTRL